MDTSEIYIGMCNCEEVQNQDCGGLYKMGTPFGDVLFYTNDKKGCSDDVWLPRQDQIQEMWDDWPTIIIMHHGGEYLIEMKPEGEAIDEKGFGEMFGKYYARSLEQAWLMLYMHQKHKKTWDKDKWVDLEGK